MDAIDRELRAEETAEKRYKGARRDSETRDQIGYETRAVRSGKKITGTGKHLRHTLGNRGNDLAALSLLNNPVAWAFIMTGETQRRGSWADLLKTITSHFHGASATAAQAKQVELIPDSDQCYVYDTMHVNPIVKQQLDAVLQNITVLEIQRDALYGAGQYGPIGADYKIHNIMDEFKIRAIPGTNQKAFCEVKVQEMQAAAGPCVGDTCPVPVYKTVSINNLRGIHVRAADQNTDHTVKAAASEVAEVKATTPVRPPELHHS